MQWRSVFGFLLFLVPAHACVGYINSPPQWLYEPHCLFEQQQIWTGERIVALTTGDFNGDGRPDLVVRTPDEVRMLINFDGGLRPYSLIPVGYRAEPRKSLVCCDPVDVAADFNHDGKLDLILGDRSVLLVGLGNGTFMPPRFLLGHPPSGLTGTGDFDADGNIDLLYFLNGAAAVMLGNGDATFRPAAVVKPGDGAVYAADLDADGHTDLVYIPCTDCANDFASVANWGQNLQIFFAREDGEFLEPITLTVPALWSRQLTLADFNNDGRPDIISSGYLVLNKGGRAFDEPRQYRWIGYYDQPPFGPAGTADLDGDGIQELLWYDTSELRTLAALRVVTDGLPSPYYRDAFAFYTWAPEDRRFAGVTDFDGDGRPDLIVATYGRGDGAILPDLPFRPEASVSILYNRIPR